MQKNQSTPPAGADNRRTFIKKASTAAAVVATVNMFKTPVYGQNTAPSTGRVIGANDRIATGHIGVGYGIGQNHFMGIQDKAADNNVVVAAGCDLFSKRREWMMGRVVLDDRKVDNGLTEANVYADYRKILDRKDIDAVVIATHDPWHAKITMDALDAGKHVYCEKPMTRYLGEAFQVYDAVKRTGKVFQIGSQGCSAGGWHLAADAIKAGKIGPLVWAQGYYCRNKPAGEWNYKIDSDVNPQTLDWKTWLGQVKMKVDFSADHFHRWRKYLAYCGGLLSDLVPHRLIPLMLATGSPEFPVRVASIGTRAIHTDRLTPGTPEREVPEHVQLIAEFPSGLMITVTSSSVNAKSPPFVIYGHKATLNIADTGIQIVPEKEFSEEIEGEKISGFIGEDIRLHEKNWFDCIRNGKTPNGNIDLAVRAQTVISLAEMSDRLKTACLFDEKTRKVMINNTGTEDGPKKEIAAFTYGSTKLS